MYVSFTPVEHLFLTMVTISLPPPTKWVPMTHPTPNRYNLGLKKNLITLITVYNINITGLFWYRKIDNAVMNE